jgi:hypothetical protein
MRGHKPLPEINQAGQEAAMGITHCFSMPFAAVRMKYVRFR